MSTLTLNLDDRHDEVLTSLAAEQELSKTALMRQALRLYQTVHLELKRGRQLAFQNPDGSFVSMVMLGGPMAAQAAPVQQESEGDVTPSQQSFEDYARRAGLSIQRSVIDSGLPYVSMPTCEAWTFWQASRRTAPVQQEAAWTVEASKDCHVLLLNGEEVLTLVGPDSNALRAALQPNQGANASQAGDAEHG